MPKPHEMEMRTIEGHDPETGETLRACKGGCGRLTTCDYCCGRCSGFARDSRLKPTEHGERCDQRHAERGPAKFTMGLDA